MEQIIFFFVAFLAIISAAYFVFARNPLYAILSLIVTFFSIAAMYVLLNAQFLGIVQVIVYAGAIMVLLLFTLMLMNLDKEDETSKPLFAKLAAVFSAGILGLVLIAALRKAQPENIEYVNSGVDYQSIKVLGKVLLNEYQVPFEFASVLLLVSMIGAVLISKKEEKI